MSEITPAMWVAVLGAVFNGAMTWGVMSTKIQWLRTDVDIAHERIEYLERRQYATPKP